MDPYRRKDFTKGSEEFQHGSQTTVVEDSVTYPPRQTQTPTCSLGGTRFWLIFLALCASLFLTSLDIGGIGTIAPTVVSDLNGGDFTWVGSAYALTSSACLPLSGNLAHVFGRRPVLVAAITIFAAGSALSASAKSMVVLIIGRAIQGIGGGGIQTLAFIIVTDIVPLSERGMYDGIIALVYAFGSGISPLVGGAFTQKASWRWFFYMNLPLCLIAIGLVTFLLNLKTPQSNVIAQIKGIDWLGNLFLMSSTSSCIIALTWGGVRYPWDSYNVLVPLIIGIFGLLLSFVYQAKCPSNPTIPMSILLNKDSFTGYFASFIHGVILSAVAYYLYVYRGVRLALNDSCRPTWFQAVHGAGPIKSGLYALPLVGGIAPAAVLQGTVVTKTGRYRTVNFFAWSFMLIGLGFFISIKEDMHLGIVAAFEVVLGVGIGALFATMFTVLAPLQVKDNAAAMGLLTFSRQFSQAWGIAIGGTVLQDGLRRRLPSELLRRLPSGVDISFALIPRISSMPEPLQSQVRSAFHDSLHRLWVILICIGGAGFLSLSLMRDIPLQSTTDERWGIVENNERNGFQVTDRIIEEEVTVGK